MYLHLHTPGTEVVPICNTSIFFFSDSSLPPSIPGADGAATTTLATPSGARRITIILVRHGDRYDYANADRWSAAVDASEASSNDANLLDESVPRGINRADPPLSALGHAQARATAKVLMAEHPTHILVSPYLRTIQTAQPLAHASGLALQLEEGLAEFKHTHGTLPRAATRFATFPEVDDSYECLYSFDRFGPPRFEKEDVLGYFRRILRMARMLRSPRFFDSTVVCFSHAASVALVQASLHSLPFTPTPTPLAPLLPPLVSPATPHDPPLTFHPRRSTL